MKEDAGIEPRTVATSALAVRRSSQISSTKESKQYYTLANEGPVRIQ
jgi:hypothetical protein